MDLKIENRAFPFIIYLALNIVHSQWILIIRIQVLGTNPSQPMPAKLREANQRSHGFQGGGKLFGASVT